MLTRKHGDLTVGGTRPDAAQLLERAQAEYLEMPGLALTAQQAGRLWGLEAPEVNQILDALVQDGFLRRTGSGYQRRE